MGRVMTRTAAIAILAALICGSAALAATKPSALAQAHSGQWELDGLPTSKAPVKQCVADLKQLLTLEHRGARCKETVLSDDGTQLKVQFTCPGGSFGTTSLRVITPRSLRIETQGIAGGGPYGYVVQARRVGECAAEKKLPNGH